MTDAEWNRVTGDASAPLSDETWQKIHASLRGNAQPAPLMISRCAWCPTSPVPLGAVVTHGICPKCEAKLLAEMEP